MNDLTLKISKALSKALTLNEEYNSDPNLKVNTRTLDKIKKRIFKHLIDWCPRFSNIYIESIELSHDGYVYDENYGRKIPVEKNALIINVVLEAGKAYGDSYYNFDMAHYKTRYDVYSPNKTGDVLIYDPINDDTFRNTRKSDRILRDFLMEAKKQLYSIGIYQTSYWSKDSIFSYNRPTPLEVERTKKIFPKDIYITIAQYND